MLADKTIEADERFNLRLSNLSHSSVVFTGERSSIGGVGTLVNDDHPAELILTQRNSRDLRYTDPRTGTQRTIRPFATDFAGTVSVATGDFNGDGIPDIAGGAGPGGGPHVQLYSSSGELLHEFMAFDPSFTGGVSIVAADFNRDGIADILAAPGPGGGPNVKVFDGADPSRLLFNKLVYTSTLTGGVNVAAGDVNGDGIPDIITAPGPGGGPNVKVFDGQSGATIRDFLAYSSTFTGGVFVATGDFNGDQFADIVTSTGPGAGPHVRVFNGQNSSSLGSFFAYDTSFSGGVRVSTADITGDGVDDVIVSAVNQPATGSLGNRVFNGATFQPVAGIDSAVLNAGGITRAAEPGNHAPLVLNAIPQFNTVQGKPFHFVIPSSTFFDADVDDRLTLDVLSTDGGPLPEWLSFDAQTNTLSGTPQSTTASPLQLLVTAFDGAPAGTSAVLGVQVNPPAVPVRPTLTVPASTVGDRTPTVTWTDDANAVRWDVSIRDLTNNVEFHRDKNVTTTSFTFPELPVTPAEYRVWVQAFNVNGQTGGFSSGRNITVTSTTPARPVFTSRPDPGGTTSDATPDFAWQADARAVRFDAELQSANGQIILRNKQLTSPEFHVTSALAEGTYRLGVQAYDGFGARSGWAFTTFTVDVPTPAQVVMTSPAAGSQITDSSPTFTWRAVAHAARYDLWVDNMSTNERQVIREPVLTGTEFTSTTLLKAGRYRVQVKAFNELNEAAPWSEIRNFEVVASPAKAAKWLAPIGTTPNPQPTFAWSAVENTARYDLWVNNLTTGQRQVIRVPDVGGTRFTPVTPLPAGNYRAQVKTFTVDGDSLWSPINDFTVAASSSAAASSSSPASASALRSSRTAATAAALKSLGVTVEVDLSADVALATAIEDLDSERADAENNETGSTDELERGTTGGKANVIAIAGTRADREASDAEADPSIYVVFEEWARRTTLM